VARLFVTPDELRRGGRIVLGEEAHRYLCRVLRLDVGSHVSLFDGEGNEASAAIAGVGQRTVELEVLAPARAAGEAVVAAAPQVTLILALTKGDKLDLVVQKATELGVARIWPVMTARAVPRAVAVREMARRTRWLRIAREAARQCGRADVPDIGTLRELDAALAEVPEGALRLALYERGPERVPLPDALAAAPAAARAPGGAIAILIGPEGGFTEDEIIRARARGFVICSMGPRTLRAETAAIAALAIVGFALGDLR